MAWQGDFPQLLPIGLPGLQFSRGEALVMGVNNNRIRVDSHLEG